VKVVLVLAAVAAGVWALLRHESGRVAAMTAEAEAVVTKVVFVKDEESSSLDSTEIHYGFTAAGAPQASSDSLPGDRTDDFVAGRKVRICYDPEDPRSTNLRTGDEPCGG
jgi:hypothetical protein